MKNIKEGDTIVIDMKLKGTDIYVSKVIKDYEGELIVEKTGVYLDSIPEKWIVYISNKKQKIL